jgi:hypothetical protein
MADLAGKKLPTVEQVETMIAGCGPTGIDALAEQFGLEPSVVEPHWIACADFDGCPKALTFRRWPAIETTVSNPLFDAQAQNTGMYSG